MAQQADTGYQGKGGNGKAEKKADAWGNVVLTPKGGKPINFSSGFNPIYADQGQLHRSLYNAAKNNGGEVTVTAQFVVRLAAVDDGTDLEFV